MPSPRSTPRALALLVLPFLLIAMLGCPDQPRQEVEVDDPFDAAVYDDLLGTWVLVEQTGPDAAIPMAADRLVTLTLTATGEYIILTEGRAGVTHLYQLADDDLLTVTDPAGARLEVFEFDLSPNRLVLRVPDSDVLAVFERRQDLIDSRPDLVPTVPVDPEPNGVPAIEPPDEDVPARQDYLDAG